MTTQSIDRPIQVVICPLCHTPGRVLDEHSFGTGWRCDRCDHPWTPERVATVTAYAKWAAEWTAAVP